MKQSDTVCKTAQGWDTFSAKYARRYQKNTSVFCMTLFNMLQIEEADCILDAGCGAGFLHQHLVNQKQPGTHLYAFDISPQMVKRAAARMKRYLLHEQIGSLDLLKQEEVDNIDIHDEIFNKVNYHLSVGSVEDLTQYKDGMFDVYVCNLVYQFISDQPKALSEAFRVLRPGGKIGFAVWGQRQNCAALWFIKEAAYKAGMFPEGVTGNFLNSSEQPIQLTKDAGFINILCWEQMNPFDVLNMNTVHNFFHPEFEGMLAKVDDEQRKTFYSEVQKMMEEYHGKHLPFPFDCYLLIAEKPK